jgi:hypothetical protein
MYMAIIINVFIQSMSRLTITTTGITEVTKVHATVLMHTRNETRYRQSTKFNHDTQGLPSSKRTSPYLLPFPNHLALEHKPPTSL